MEKQFPYYKRGKILEFQFENPQDRRVFVKNHFEVENWNITFEDSQTDGDEVSQYVEIMHRDALLYMCAHSTYMHHHWKDGEMVNKI